MPPFQYKAVDAEGHVVEGQLMLADRPAVLAHLRAHRLSPLAVSEQRQRRRAGRRRRVTRRDIDRFTAQLASMLQASLPLGRALRAVREQAPSEAMEELLADLGARVEAGASLSEALEAHPRRFPDFYRSMVRAGEIGGVLGPSLARLAAMQDKRAELAGRLRGALVYPAIMATVMAGSIWILLTFVVPRFAATFADMGAALPWPTRVLLAVSGFFATWWWLAIGLVAASGAAFWRWSETPGGGLTIDRALLAAPVVGPLLRRFGLATIATTMGSMLQTGVPILSVLEASRDVAGNRVFSRALGRVREAVREGATLEAALAAHPRVFPALMVSMVATGEEAGTLPAMLESMGGYWTREADESVKTLTTLLEPVITLTMGLLVGAIVIAMLLPVFQLTEMLG